MSTQVQRLEHIQSLNEIISIELLASFALLGIFPYIAKFAINRWKSSRALAPYNKPAQFDRNLIVIGAGSGGLVSAYIAAAVKAKVTLIEKHKMGRLLKYRLRAF